jgi:hypothetical protein
VPLASFHSEVPDIAAMFFDSGRLYYTLQGDGHLYYRYFTPESGVVGAVRCTASAGVGGIDFAHAAGAFVTGDTLYVATTDGNLHRVAFADGAPVGTGSLVSGPGVDGTNWSSRAMFLYKPARAS